MTETVLLPPIAETPGSGSSEHVVVDLGKQKGKRVKALRRGRGPLMDDVAECVEGLRKEGRIRADAATVIVVVERKRKRNMFPIKM
jgi:hypothetical protein